MLIRKRILKSATLCTGYIYNSVDELLILRRLHVKGRPRPDRRFIPVLWSPPVVGWLKVNTDGSSLAAPGESVSAGIFRDSGGRVIGCFSIDVGILFAYEAELLAAITAVEIAYDREPWRFLARWLRVLSLLPLFEFRISHIFREGNLVADALSKLGYFLDWSNSTPPEIVDFLRDDQNRVIGRRGAFKPILP
ncbi:Polynucleotidyl transferase- ribonuclease H-like superfamily protein [Striga hermonthica]|uniref:Polynucleotidyl transferase- ribonuclease H-like superfamily protein n=1 Tax=Striga hermonthica TaxID=68872 RepID=A0A9N7NTJ2_STRHE|nr:Polynucleotidyl transferase- ribonuclease H-like superfamily protein [Striga hermonthica]